MKKRLGERRFKMGPAFPFIDAVYKCHQVSSSTFKGVTVLALPHKRPSAAPPPALVLHRGALRLVLVDGVEGVAVTGVL